jgi:hypothetical protein
MEARTVSSLPTGARHHGAVIARRFPGGIDGARTSDLRRERPSLGQNPQAISMIRYTLRVK